MFGKLARLFLIAAVTEFGGALIGAGKGWLERKLQPQAKPPAAEDGAAVATPQGTIIADAEGRTIGFATGMEQASKKAPEAPVQEP